MTATMPSSSKCPICGVTTSLVSFPVASMKPGESVSVNLDELVPEKTESVTCASCLEKAKDRGTRAYRIANDLITYCLVFVKFVGDDGVEYHFADGSGRSTAKAHPKLQGVRGGWRAAERIARDTFKNLGPEWRLLSSADWTRDSWGDQYHLAEQAGTAFYDMELRAELEKRDGLRKKRDGPHPCVRTWVNGVLPPCHSCPDASPCPRNPGRSWWLASAYSRTGERFKGATRWPSLDSLKRAVELAWPGCTWHDRGGMGWIATTTDPKAKGSSSCLYLGSSKASLDDRLPIVAELVERWNEPAVTDTGEKT